MSTLEELEKIDKIKSKILKYIFYKKRTEREIREKFKEIDNDILEEIIELFKENGYIDDSKYIEKSINEFIAINTLSVREVQYKLQTKGIDNDLLQDYIDKNYERLQQYELDSARKIINKKSATMEQQDIKQYLQKKGYSAENIRQALENEE